ncbi:MAG TPA: rhodanese-like domain-containing protein [Candidatus Acidoferrum sp.]|nr:rhodanese-like domain-containing protein [Candidatus Acidoferrum sp.]
MIIIDIREPDEAIVNIPLSKLEREIAGRAHFQERIVLLCESGARSRAGALLLRGLGYENVCTLSLKTFEGQCVEDDRD